MRLFLGKNIEERASALVLLGIFALLFLGARYAQLDIQHIDFNWKKYRSWVFLAGSFTAFFTPFAVFGSAIIIRMVKRKQ